MATPPADPAALADPDRVLPTGWRGSADRVVTVTGDTTGLHLLVADEASGYAWRTAATLGDAAYDADSWIGQACLTGSGRQAVVVYAPRTFTNDPLAKDQGAFVAVVDLTTGAVHRLAVRASLAYFNPGCGTGETVAVSSLDETSAPVTTTINLIDAATGSVTAAPVVDGQVTSAVPTAGGVVAAQGAALVRITAGGAVSLLRQEAGVPFRLHPDAGRGVAYEVAVGADAQVRRYADGRSTLLGRAPMSTVQLSATAGHVFVLGADRAAIRTAGLPGWDAVDAPVNSSVSSTGTLAVTTVDRASAGRPDPDRPEPVTITATVPGNHKSVTFAVHPATLTNGGNGPASPPRAFGPGRQPRTVTSSAQPETVASDAQPQVGTSVLPIGNDPTDPDRGCSVTRNNVNQQAYQATANQVEWAADLAVHGQLTVTRPVDWNGSGNSSTYQIQGSGGMFPLASLHGGGTVPAQVLLGALSQESNTMHASPHLVDGETGNFNQGGYYGDWVSWNTVDCGYGVGQVTSGMAVADGHGTFSTQQQQAIANDYAANIAASLNLLIEKWNGLYDQGIVANDGSSADIENWYLALWAYNSGIQPDSRFGNTTGCAPSPTCTDGDGHWGLGWSNNPANPSYPADRGMFDGQDPFDTKHPNLWPYEENAIGFAYRPVARFDYTIGTWAPAFQAAGLQEVAPLPDENTLCVLSVNDCEPGAGVDINGHSGAGLCTLASFRCWWHEPVSWMTGSCAINGCGTENLAYHGGDAEPPRPNVYPANCSTSGLPAGARVIDDTLAPDPIGSCPHTWTNGGTFGFTFAAAPAGGCTSNCITYRSKIDFHQAGTSGFGGHFWFTHTVAPFESDLEVTGTWRLDPPNAWTRLFVHLPMVGAQTQQARYFINQPNGQQKFRVIPTNNGANTWGDIGVYDMRGTGDATVTLNNITQDGIGTQDVAWDALAYVPLPAKPANFVVALGDSYSSGEGTGDYYHVSDQYGDTPDRRNACRRSPHAWARQVILPGESQTIGQLADSENPSVSFAFAACSGARTFNVASAHEPWTPYGGQTLPSGSYGELPQLDQGLLDENTTVVLLNIGGNDANFAPTLMGCLKTDCTGDEAAIENQILTQVKPRVAEVVTEIRERAPNAWIVVAGYPHLFNDFVALDTCPSSVLPACAIILLQGYSISSPEAAMLNRVSDYLMATALPNDPANKVLGVDVIPSFGGHTISTWASSDYLNAITMPNTVPNASGEKSVLNGGVTGMGSFHPTALGAKNGYAAAVSVAIAAAF